MEGVRESVAGPEDVDAALLLRAAVEGESSGGELVFFRLVGVGGSGEVRWGCGGGEREGGGRGEPWPRCCGECGLVGE